MADSKLSALTAEAAPTAADIIPIADPTTGVISKLTLQGLKDILETITPTVPPSGYQAETDTFITAVEGTGVTLTTPQKDAVDALVVSMKAIGWSKFTAVYPLIGGTANAHKFNLVNPADTDGAKRIAWVGAGTHSANGYIAGSATANFGKTFVLDSDIAGTVLDYNGHMGVYLRVNTVSAHALQMAGGTLGSGSNGVYLRTGNTDDIIRYGMSGDVQVPSTAAATDNTGFILGAVTSNVKGHLYQDGVKIGEKNTHSLIANPLGYMITMNGYSGSANPTTVAAGSTTQEIAFFSLGDGLSEAECVTYSNAVVAFQTALSRNV